ncbi:NUDIX domain-containing protein [Chloroflexota bacterium]
MEVPAGGLSPDPTPKEVAPRELLEEVGGRAAELRYVGQFYTSNGISNEVAYVYLAIGVELGEANREPTELMEIRLVPVDEAMRMAREGEISDGPSALALLWCEPLLRPLWGRIPKPDAHNRGTRLPWPPARAISMDGPTPCWFGFGSSELMVYNEGRQLTAKSEDALDETLLSISTAKQNLLTR